MTDKQQPPKRWIVSQTVWLQVSGNYDAERRVRTLVACEDTTIGHIAEWAAKRAGTVLGCGDINITEADETP